MKDSMFTNPCLTDDLVDFLTPGHPRGTFDEEGRYIRRKRTEEAPKAETRPAERHERRKPHAAWKPEVYAKEETDEEKLIRIRNNFYQQRRYLRRHGYIIGDNNVAYYTDKTQRIKTEDSSVFFTFKPWDYGQER